MQEGEKRIPDVDKAWTAARAEDAMRTKIIPDAKEALGESKGNSGDKATWDALADIAGEERVDAYDPNAEAEVDGLRQRAEEAIAKIDDFLAGHNLASISETRPEIKPYYEALNKARVYFEGAIDQMDLGGSLGASGKYMQAFHPRYTVPKTIATVEQTFKIIESFLEQS